MIRYSKLTDLELASLLKERDHAAFTEIYNRYWKAMFVYAFKRLKDEDEAADAVQEIFTNLWNRSGEFRIDTDVKSYLYIATRNQALNILNKSTRRNDYIERLAGAFEDGLNITDDELNFREFSRILEQQVENLPPRMKAIYVKSREQGLSHKTIAEELGITEDSSKTILNRALNSLRTKLTPFLPVLFFFLGR